jgi:hypothetical protein
MVRWINAHLTVGLPEDEYERIKRHPEIKWGAVARKAVIQYLNELEKMGEIQFKLELNQDEDSKA